jgi:AcrR family transcriptional regulator
MATRDAEATKARIFAAATEEFAAYGIAGARVDRIAQKAQANKQLIYAYFGDKQKLFYKVLDRALVQVAAMVSTDITDLDKWVDEHIDYHRDHPELLRLLMWESLEVPSEETCRSEARRERYGIKKQKIADAQERGLVRRDMPPAFMLMMMMGVVNYAAALPNVRELVFDGEQCDPEMLRAWTRDAVKRVAARARDERDEHAGTDAGRYAGPAGESADAGPKAPTARSS